MKLARFYLHHKFLYYFLWWLTLTVIGCLPIFLVRDEFLSNALRYGLLCVGIIGMLFAELKVQTLTKLLTQQCDPVAYLQQSDFLLAGLDLSKKITNGYRNAECVTLLINRNAAFCDLGRFEEATEIFRFLQNCAGNRLSPVQMAAIYHNLAYISAQRGDMSFAKYYAAEERAAWKKWKPIAKSVKAQRWLAETGTAAMLLQKQGKVSEALALYTQMEQFLQTQKKPVIREQVGTAFEAGALYFQLKKYSEAAPRLQFAFENGGTTVYRVKAAAKAAEMFRQCRHERIKYRNNTMKTEVLSAYTDGGKLNEETISRAAKLLAAGEVVAVPTETVYGLAANAYDETAVRKIFSAKGRPQDNPLIVHIADFEDIYDLVSVVPTAAKKLADAFWPGPLTVILPKSDKIPDAVSAGFATVAVRYPSHPVAQAVIQACGVPLAAPSANRSGSPSPTNAKYVLDDMDGRIPLILDGGGSQVGVESTVVTLATEVPRVLRPGGVTVEQLREVLGEVEVDDAVLHQLKAGETAASPGMKYKHYAPKADITIVRGSFSQFQEFVKGKDAFVLVFAGEENAFDRAVTYGRADDDRAQANRLFDALRELDEQGAKTVYARCPALSGVGLAVYNRLIRAAGFHLVDLKEEQNG